MNTTTNSTSIIPLANSEIAEKLNNQVFSVIGQEKLIGFQRAFLIANSIKELKNLLTPEYMKPIMELQGNKLGFRTDKDSSGGYPEHIVKNCLIEAVLMGLQPYNNEFNIIAGNTYPTKEGMGSLLKQIPGLWYEIIPQLPRVNGGSAAILMKIRWKIFNGVEQNREIDLPIKVNNFMGTDAIIGKATRKARAWLFFTITGNEIQDGDVVDLDSLNAKTKGAEVDKDEERLILMLSDCKTVEEVEILQDSLPDVDQKIFQDKKLELSGGTKS